MPIREVEDRSMWENVETFYRQGSAPFFQHDTDTDTEDFPPPKYQFKQHLITLTNDGVEENKSTELNGRVYGMECDGEEWTYTLFGNMGMPFEVEESKLMPVKPERVKSLVVYQHELEWVFDDATLGIEKEPFIKGIDMIIDRMTVLLPSPEKGFVLRYSDYPFPEFRARLHWRRAEHDGNWYACPQFRTEGWLCPVLYQYFDAPPQTLYVQALPLH